MTLGRRNESPTGKLPENSPLLTLPGLFNEPTDIAFDSQGNIYVTDGYGNSRVQKFDKYGNFLLTWGDKGSKEGQFITPHGIAIDSQDHIYVADRSNNRIQVFDTNGKFIRMFETKIERAYKDDVLAVPPLSPPGEDGFYRSLLPNSICITPGPDPVLYANDLVPGAVYVFSLDGQPLGRLGTSGKKLGQFGWMHELSCGHARNELYVGEMVNMRVQKLTLHLENLKSRPDGN